jgi:hypothetical protein
VGARCLTLVKLRLKNKWAGYGTVHTAGKFRGLDLEVPHSELAMHTRAAGKKLIAWACKPSGRECGIVFAEPKGGCGDTFGLPTEVLPHGVLRRMGGPAARSLSGAHRRRR